MLIRIFSAATVAIALGLAAPPAKAQNAKAPTRDLPAAWNVGAVGVGHGEDGKSPKTTAPNGMTIQIGEEGEAGVAYDLDLCRMVGAWTGKIGVPAQPASATAHPTSVKDVVFATGGVAGFLAASAAATWADPRPEAAGPLPEGHAHFEGFFVNRDQTILKWNIGGTEVMELPAYDVVLNGGGYFTRTFQVAPSDQPLRILVASDPQPDGPVDFLTHKRTEGEVIGLEGKERVMQSTPWVHGDRGEVMIWAAGDPDGSMWRLINGELALEVPPRTKAITFQIAYWTAPKSDPDGKTAPLFYREPEIDLAALSRAGTWRTLPASGVATAAKHSN
ncbi:MAG TPA: DUF6797 domain-containing protein [Chthoniobacter sp.]|jgi:hypothetical protein